MTIINDFANLSLIKLNSAIVLRMFNGKTKDLRTKENNKP